MTYRKAQIHLTSPGCELILSDQILKISNNSDTIQESYVNLGKLYNYAAIDMDIKEQKHNTCSASALLSLYKDEENRFVITQRDSDAGNNQITLEIVKNGASVLLDTLSEKCMACNYTCIV
jgi:hypothetical protein